MNNTTLDLKNIKGVFFDMDGTILDSMWLWKAIDIEYLNRFGCEYPEGLQEEIAGMSFHQTANYFKERFKIHIVNLNLFFNYPLIVLPADSPRGV